MKLYVASSWRNDTQPVLVKFLREAGHEVYDFKNPGPENTGFSWRSVDPEWQNWNNNQYIAALKDPIAEIGFMSDFDAMKWADACVLVLPCGRSAHTEAGWMQGQGKPVIVLLDPHGQEPELMYKIYYSLETRFTGVKNTLRELQEAKHNFNIGDWLFFEYELFQVKEVDENGVREISNGMTTTNGMLNDRCFPLKLENKVCSDNFAFWDEKLHAEVNGLNFPDIHRYMVILWQYALTGYNQVKATEVRDALDVFCEDLLDAVHEKSLGMGTEPRQINGVKIFRD